MGAGRSVVSRKWPMHLAVRLRALRAKLAAKNLSAMLVTHPADIRYLTGFGGEDSWALVTPGRVIILSDSRFEEELHATCPYARTVMRKNAMSEALERVVRAAKVRRFAVQAEHMTIQQRGVIASRIGRPAMVPVTGWLLEQRAIKDDDEVGLISRAIDIQQRAYLATIGTIKPGVSEREIAARLEYEMRRLGADGASFPTIVAAGANGSIPHHRPGDAKVKPNSAVLIDWGAKFGGYCGDMTRVVFVGRPPRRLREIYRVVRDAQVAGLEAIGPGKELREVDAAARRVIEDAGYGERFGHGLGHGIGLEIHESPSMGKSVKGRLAVGQVVTVEPGVYLPGVGGVRIEDDVLVTASGGRKLSSLPTGLESAMI